MSILKRFNKNVSGSNNKIYDYTPIITSMGDFKKIEDIDVILNSWRNILLTPKGSYIYDPEYGSDLYKLLFEQSDDILIDEIKTEIIEQLIRYDSRATIDEIEISTTPDRKSYIINLYIDYDGIEKNLTLNFKI